MYVERVARLEKEAQSLKRVSEEVFRVQKQIDGEKAERESASSQLQSDLQQLLSEFLAFMCSAGSCMLLSVLHFSGYHAWARQNRLLGPGPAGPKLYTCLIPQPTGCMYNQHCTTAATFC